LLWASVLLYSLLSSSSASPPSTMSYHFPSFSTLYHSPPLRRPPSLRHSLHHSIALLPPPLALPLFSLILILVFFARPSLPHPPPPLLLLIFARHHHSFSLYISLSLAGGWCSTRACVLLLSAVLLIRSWALREASLSAGSLGGIAQCFCFARRHFGRNFGDVAMFRELSPKNMQVHHATNC
jgi:hypothetical protein